MSLKGILAIGGKPGLYKHVAQAKNAIIVEDIETGKRFPAHATAKISALEDIAIFTDSEEISLVDVFKSIKNECKSGPVSFEPKKAEPDVLKQFMEKILPEYDRDRVYVSDMKKVFSWYNFLQGHDMLSFEEQQIDEEQEEKAEVSEKEEIVEK